MAGRKDALQILITGGVTQGLLDGLNTARIVLLSFADAVKEVSNTKMGSGFDDFAKVVERTVQNVGKSMTEAEKYFQRYGEAATKGMQAESAAADKTAAALKRVAEAKKGMATTSKDTGDAGDGEEGPDPFTMLDPAKVDDLKARLQAFHGILAEKTAHEYAKQIHALYNSLVQLGQIDPTVQTFDQFVQKMDLSGVTAQVATGQIQKTAEGFRSLEPAGRQALGITEQMSESLKKFDAKPTQYIRQLYDALHSIGQIPAETTFEQFYNKVDQAALSSVNFSGKLNKLDATFKNWTESQIRALGITKEQEKALRDAVKGPTLYEQKLKELRLEQASGQEEAKKYHSSLVYLSQQYGKADSEIKPYISTLDNLRSHTERMAKQAEQMGKHDIAKVFRNVKPAAAVMKTVSGEITVTNNKLQILKESGKDIFKNVSTEEINEALSQFDLMSNDIKRLAEDWKISEAQATEYHNELQRIYQEMQRLHDQTGEVGLLDEAQLQRHKDDIKTLEKNVKDFRGFITTDLGQTGFDTLRDTIHHMNRDVKTHEEQLKRVQKQQETWRKKSQEVANSYKNLRATVVDLEKRDFSIMDKAQTTKAVADISAAESKLRRIRDLLGDPNAGKEMEKRLTELRRETDRWRTNMEKAIEGMDTQAQRESMRALADEYGHHTTNINRYKKAVREVTEFDHRHMDQITDKIHKLRQQSKQYKEQGRDTSKLTAEIERLNKKHHDLANGVKMTDRVKQRYSETINNVSKSQSKLNRDLGASRREMTTFEKGLSRIYARIKQFGAFILAAYVLQGFRRAIRSTVQILAEFDQALYNLQAIINITAQEAEAMGRTILDVARTTKFSAGEVAEGVVLLGQAGFDAVEAIQAVGAVANLATGTLEDFRKVVDLMTTTVRAFHLETVQSAEISDIFANAINNSKLVIDKLATAFNYVGAAGHQAGLTLNDVSGTLMVLANNGIRASTMGTGLRRMMLQMLAPNIRLRAALEASGQAIADLNPKLVGWEQALRNLAPLMWDFEKDTVDMGKASEFFGTRASQVAAVLMDSVAKGGALSEAIEQTREIGAAARMAGLQQEGLEVKFKNLQDRLNNVVIAMGETGFTGVLKTMVDVLAHATTGIEQFFRAFPDAISVTSTAVAIAGLSLAIAAVSKSATLAAPALKIFWAAATGPVAKFAIAISVVTGVVTYFNNRLGQLAETHARFAIEIGEGIAALEGWERVLKSAVKESEKAYRDSLRRFVEENEELSNSILKIINDYDLLDGQTAHTLDEVDALAGGVEEAGKIFEEAFNIESIKRNEDQIKQWAKSATNALKEASAYTDRGDDPYSMRFPAFFPNMHLDFDNLETLDGQLKNVRQRIDEVNKQAEEGLIRSEAQKQIIENLEAEEQAIIKVREEAAKYITQIGDGLTQIAKREGLEGEALDEYLNQFFEDASDELKAIEDSIREHITRGLSAGADEGIKQLLGRFDDGRVARAMREMTEDMGYLQLMEFRDGIEAVEEAATKYLNFLEDNKDEFGLHDTDISRMAMDNYIKLLKEHHASVVGEQASFEERLAALRERASQKRNLEAQLITDEREKIEAEHTNKMLDLNKDYWAERQALDTEHVDYDDMLEALDERHKLQEKILEKENKNAIEAFEEQQRVQEHQHELQLLNIQKHNADVTGNREQAKELQIQILEAQFKEEKRQHKDNKDYIEELERKHRAEVIKIRQGYYDAEIQAALEKERVLAEIARDKEKLREVERKKFEEDLRQEAKMYIDEYGISREQADKWIETRRTEYRKEQNIEILREQVDHDRAMEDQSEKAFKREKELIEKEHELRLYLGEDSIKSEEEREQALKELRERYAKETFDLWKTMWENIHNITTDFIGDSLKGEFESFSDYFEGFTNSITDIWSQMLSKMITDFAQGMEVTMTEGQAALGILANAMQAVQQGGTQAAGTAIGTAIGAFWGPAGMAVGGSLGGMVGGLFGGKSGPSEAEMFIKELQENTKEIRRNTEALRMELYERAPGMAKFEQIEQEMMNRIGDFIESPKEGLSLPDIYEREKEAVEKGWWGTEAEFQEFSEAYHNFMKAVDDQALEMILKYSKEIDQIFLKWGEDIPGDAYPLTGVELENIIAEFDEQFVELAKHAKSTLETVGGEFSRVASDFEHFDLKSMANKFADGTFKFLETAYETAENEIRKLEAFAEEGSVIDTAIKVLEAEKRAMERKHGAQSREVAEIQTMIDEYELLRKAIGLTRESFEEEYKLRRQDIFDDMGQYVRDIYQPLDPMESMQQRVLHDFDRFIEDLLDKGAAYDEIVGAFELLEIALDGLKLKETYEDATRALDQAIRKEEALINARLSAADTLDRLINQLMISDLAPAQSMEYMHDRYDQLVRDMRQAETPEEVSAASQALSGFVPDFLDYAADFGGQYDELFYSVMGDLREMEQYQRQEAQTEQALLRNIQEELGRTGDEIVSLEEAYRQYQEAKATLDANWMDGELERLDGIGSTLLSIEDMMDEHLSGFMGAALERTYGGPVTGEKVGENMGELNWPDAFDPLGNAGMRHGGIISGPETGYSLPNVTFHGTEHITPDSEMKEVKQLLGELVSMQADGSGPVIVNIRMGERQFEDFVFDTVRTHSGTRNQIKRIPRA